MEAIQEKVIGMVMAAEAYNETGTDRQKAWDLLNSVRTRAFL